MGVLFQMENDFKEIKGKFFRRTAKKNPSQFKVALEKRDFPHLPVQEINGFGLDSIAMRTMGMFGIDEEVAYLNYDAIVKMGDVVFKMSLTELNNFVSVLSGRLNTFQRHVLSNTTKSECNEIATALLKMHGGTNETIG